MLPSLLYHLVAHYHLQVQYEGEERDIAVDLKDVKKGLLQYIHIML